MQGVGVIVFKLVPFEQHTDRFVQLVELGVLACELVDGLLQVEWRR